MRRRVSSGPVLPCVRSAPWPRSWRVPSLLYETYVCHGGSMLKRLFTFVPALALPALLAAQTPKVAAPNEHASDVAKAKVAANMARRATHVRGEAVGLDNRPVTPATPATRATRATPAVPSPDGGPATRATPATPATPAPPASPSHRPDNPGLGHARRP